MYSMSVKWKCWNSWDGAQGFNEHDNGQGAESSCPDQTLGRKTCPWNAPPHPLCTGQAGNYWQKVFFHVPFVSQAFTALSLTQHIDIYIDKFIFRATAIGFLLEHISFSNYIQIQKRGRNLLLWCKPCLISGFSAFALFLPPFDALGPHPWEHMLS